MPRVITSELFPVNPGYITNICLAGRQLTTTCALYILQQEQDTFRLQAHHLPTMIHDETSPALSPSKKRQPMTYFLYPGLDSADLTKFLSKNKASHACMRKALHDLNVNAPCTLLPASNDVTPDDIEDDEVFLTNNDYEVVTEKITSLQLEEYCPDDREIMDDLDPRTTDLDSSMDRSRCDGRSSQASSQLTLQNCEMMSLTEEKHCERSSSLTSGPRRRKKVHFKKIQRFFKRIRYFFKSRRVHSHARSFDILQVCNKCGRIADVKVHTC